MWVCHQGFRAFNSFGDSYTFVREVKGRGDLLIFLFVIFEPI
jgi:hypothetical protein